MEVKITVLRIRPSVTQGYAAVYINGQKAITFADTIELRKPNEPYYGENIGGWASTIPDMQFIIGALYHDFDNVYKFSDTVKDILNIEKEKEQAAAKTVMTELEELAKIHGWATKIKARGEVATLVGVQRLEGFRVEPIYRFPGGDSLISECEMIPYEEDGE